MNTTVRRLGGIIRKFIEKCADLTMLEKPLG
jgi:hypothetical protein